jgi:hypothetical protein
MSDTEDIKRILKDILSERNPSGGSAGSGNTDTRDYRTRMDDLIKSSKQAGDSFNKLNGGLKLSSRAQYEHRVAMKEANDELYELELALTKHRRGTNLLTDAQLKSVEARRKELASMTQQSTAAQTFVNKLQDGAKFLIGYYTAVQQATLQGIGQVLSTVQAGGSGFAIANAQMAMQLDVANVHVQQLAGATQAAGGAIAMIPGIASKLVGFGLIIGAEAKKSSSQLQTDAQKMFNQLLMAGGDQLLNSYTNLTRTGAVLAGGADSIRNALAVGGTMQLSFQTFEKMLAGNTELLASSNMGMAKASEMLAKVGATLKSKGIDKGLQAIGIGFEETGAIISTVMRDIARQGRPVGQKEVEQQTVEYAKNLALMASLSGKSVKEELAKRQQAQSEFGYRARMMQLGMKADSEQAKVMEHMVSGPFRAAILEIDRYGGILNKEVQAQAQLMPELGEYLADMARLFGNGNLTVQKEMELRAKLGPRLENSLKNNPLLTDLAIARTKLEAPLNAFIEEFDTTMKRNATSYAEQMAVINTEYFKGIQAKLDGTDLTSVLLSMKSIGEEFSAKFQDEIITKIPQIAKLLKKALEDAEKLLKKGPTVNTGPLDTVTKLMQDLLPFAVALLAVTKAFGAIRAMLPGGKPAATTTTTETVKTETAKAQEQGRLSKLVEKVKPKAPSGAQLDIARMELGLSGNATKAEIEAARTAKFAAKYGKYIKGAGTLGVLAQGYTNVSNASKIREDEKAGKITATEANAKVTAEAFDFAGALGSSAAGGKVGALIGASIGVWFGGVGAGPGAIIGGVLGAIGGGLLYYLTPAQQWVKKIGEGFSNWWQSWTFKGIWDTIGKGLGSAMTVVSDWADGAYKTVTGWFSSGDKPKPPPNTVKNDGTPSTTVAATLPAVTGKIPDGLKLMSNGGLGVSLMQGGNLVTLGTEGKAAFVEVFSNALKNAQGGAGSLNTTSFSTAFYKPKLNPQGKAVTEADFAEIGKGDPVVYALGKLTKIAAESASDMRSLASKMGASLDTQSDSKRYLKNMAGAFR